MKKSVFFGLILILLVNPFISDAQSPSSLFTAVDTAQSPLNSEQRNRLNKINELGVYIKYEFIHIENLAEQQVEGKVALTFGLNPCGTSKYLASRGVEYISEEDYSWYG